LRARKTPLAAIEIVAMSSTMLTAITMSGCADNKLGMKPVVR
jgi:hypothetical protein